MCENISLIKANSNGARYISLISLRTNHCSTVEKSSFKCLFDVLCLLSYDQVVIFSRKIVLTFCSGYSEYLQLVSYLR
jgi:hypothetical protein